MYALIVAASEVEADQPSPRDCFAILRGYGGFFFPRNTRLACGELTYFGEKEKTDDRFLERKTIIGT
jgi:hypothetical protein